MEFDAGDKFLVVNDYDDSKQGRLSIKRGEVLEFVEAVTIKQTYREGEIELQNLWVCCRNCDGEVGDCMLRMLEPQLEETVLRRKIEALKDEVKGLSMDGRDVAQHSTRLRDISCAHPQAAAMLFELGVVKALVKPIVDHPSTGKEAGLPSRYLSDMIAVLVFVCKSNVNGVGETCIGKLCSKKKFIDRLIALVDSLYTGTQDGDCAPVGAPAAAVLGCIAHNSTYGSILAKRKDLVLITLKIIKGVRIKDGCALNIDRTYVAKYLPGILEIVSGLATHSNGKKLLLQLGAVQVLEAMSEEAHTRGPYVTGQTTLLFLDDARRKQSKAQPKLLRRKNASSVSSQTGHVMISYNWGSQDLAIRLAQFLKANKYRVWIDVEQMKGNVAEKMATAVEACDVALILYSEKYSNSPNCLMEAEYISLLGKEFIPVLAEPNADQIRGILGLLRGRKMYVDLSDLTSFEKRASELIFFLGRKGFSEEGGCLIDIVREFEDQDSSGEVVSLARKVTLLEQENARLTKQNQELSERMTSVEHKLEEVQRLLLLHTSTTK